MNMEMASYFGSHLLSVQFPLSSGAGICISTVCHDGMAGKTFIFDERLTIADGAALTSLVVKTPATEHGFFE